MTHCDKKEAEDRIFEGIGGKDEKGEEKINKNFKKDLQLERECGIISNVTEKTVHRGIAQLVEYRSPKPWVAGSNPPAPAINRSQTASVFLFSGVF